MRDFGKVRVFTSLSRRRTITITLAHRVTSADDVIGARPALVTMPLFGPQSSRQVSLHLRRLLVPSGQPSFLVQTNLARVSLKHVQLAGSARGQPHASWSMFRFFVHTTHEMWHSSSAIRERLFDKLILFSRMVHKQSNVYLTLHVRRVAQSCTLYRRLYTPNEFRNVFVDQFLEQVRRWSTKIRHRTCFLHRFLNRHRFLLSFTACGMFSWEEARITDHELEELIQEFVSVEKLKLELEEKGKTNTTTQRVSKQEGGDGSEQGSTEISNPDGSFMVVNCMEAQSQSVIEWEEIINQPDFHVWRKSVNSTSLYEYKVFGTFTDISAYSFYSVQRDLQYRKEWDRLVIKLDIVDVEPDRGVTSDGNSSNLVDSGNELIHWIMKYPYPMKNREYLYLRRSRIDMENRFIILVSRSVPYDKIPESDEQVRVYDYMSQMVIRPHEGQDFDQNGFDYMLTYFDDPRASFPSPAYNWMACRGVPDFVEKLHQAALRLSSFYRSQNEDTDEDRSFDIWSSEIHDITDERSLKLALSKSAKSTGVNVESSDKSTLTNARENPSRNSCSTESSEKAKSQNQSGFSLNPLNIWT